MIWRLVALLFLATPAAAQGLVENGRILWSRALPEFGGLSGIEVGADGSFVAISDKARFFTGRLVFTDGQLTGVEDGASLPILDSKGQLLDKRNTDSEGLAQVPGGDFLVSFESNDRIMLHPTLDSAGEFLDKHPDFRALGYNNGLEALAVDAAGIVYAIPEQAGAPDMPIPIYRFDGTTWDNDLSLPYAEGYQPTGADFGPDSKLYYVERLYRRLTGFEARIRRIEPGSTAPPDLLYAFELNTNNNFEGLSVWTDRDGRTHVTVVSDDNFNFFQATVLADFLLPASVEPLL